MTIADGMHQIVDNINEARSARVSEVGAIRVGVQKDLKQFGRVRRHNATAQKKTLNKYVKTLRHDTQDMLGGFSASQIAMGQECRKELGDFTDQLTKDVSNIRIDNRDFIHQLTKDVNNIRLDSVNMIHGFADERVANEIELSRTLKSYHDERVTNGIELSRTLKSYHDGITEDVQHLLGMFKQERIPVQKELAEAHAIWQSHVSGGYVPTKAPKRTVAKAAEVTKTPEKKEDTTLKGKILKVIKASPKGITLAKAGKKIDVEWRTLIRPAKELLEEGMVTKKETQYFPS